LYGIEKEGIVSKRKKKVKKRKKFLIIASFN